MTATPETPKGKGENAIEAIVALATSLADRTYFNRPLDEMNADRAVLAKFIEIADVVRKSHDDIFDEEMLAGNKNVVEYKRFRKKNESKKNPLADLFK